MYGSTNAPHQSSKEIQTRTNLGTHHRFKADKQLVKIAQYSFLHGQSVGQRIQLLPIEFVDIMVEQPQQSRNSRRMIKLEHRIMGNRLGQSSRSLKILEPQTVGEVSVTSKNVAGGTI